MTNVQSPQTQATTKTRPKALNLLEVEQKREKRVGSIASRHSKTESCTVVEEKLGALLDSVGRAGNCVADGEV